LLPVFLFLFIYIFLFNLLLSGAYTREGRYGLQVKLSGRKGIPSQSGDLGLKGTDQFHYIQAVVLGLMFVQVEKGLKLLFISFHQKSLQLAFVIFLEVVEGWAKLVWSEIVSVTLGILKDPGVAVLLKDLLEALNHIGLRLKP
jgi:hypothetical protein